LASGSHTVEDALTLDELADRVLGGGDVLAPPSSFVTGLEHATLSDDQTRAMRMGQRVTLDGPSPAMRSRRWILRATSSVSCSADRIRGSPSWSWHLATIRRTGSLSS